MDHVDLRSRVVALEQLTPRVSALEAWQRNQDINEAKREANWTALTTRLDERFATLESQIKEVAGTLRFIGKTVIGAIILAVVAFMVAGGFHVP